MLAVGAMRYAQTTKAAPTATRPTANRSARLPLGISEALEGLSAGRSSWRSAATFRDWRISTPTYEVALMRLPIQFRRGGSWVTVITGPPGGYLTKVTTRQAGIKTATPTQAGGEFRRVRGHDTDASRTLRRSRVRDLPRSDDLKVVVGGS